MSHYSPVKINKADLKPEIKVQKKHRKKIQVAKTKYTSPQDVRKLQKTFSSSKRSSQTEFIKQNSLVESDVEPFSIEEFSFSEEIQSNFHKIQGKILYTISGKGYKIIDESQHQKEKNLTEKLQNIGYVELNVGIKIFELCQRDFQTQFLTIKDCKNFEFNLQKSLKARFGSKNSKLIQQKKLQITESFKLIFYRKRQLELHEVIMFLIDCGLMDEITELLIDIFPQQIETF